MKIISIKIGNAKKIKYKSINYLYVETERCGL